MFNTDQRCVVTLDAGGTNFVFGAMRGCEFVGDTVKYPSNAHELKLCLDTLVKGFGEIISRLDSPPSAISFAFPGPADYPNGIIGGNLPNFPSFRDGVALGPFLQETFGLPVFINNDGCLFAYGEAMGGALPDINARLTAYGSKKRYKNLLGVTLGTGFGAGVVIDGVLLQGDNACGGSVWCFRNRLYPQYITEESVSIRAVKRVYSELSGDSREYTPKEIYDIAEGVSPGNQKAARDSFAELGMCAGDTLAMAATIVDGIIVIGGGLSGASKYIFPSLLSEMNGQLGMMNGDKFGRMQMRVYNLDDDAEFGRFAEGEPHVLEIYGSSNKHVTYDPIKRIGVTTSKIGASKAISVGAYIYALSHL